MRVTSSMYYESLYGNNNSKLNEKLFDVNKQIASGLKIQYASDDVATFTETMRLDNEITTLGQIKQSTESGYKISNQSDVILNDFEDSMNRFRTLLIQAANDTNDTTSRDAISAELRGLEKHLKNLSNTSINGQFLFSGSMVDVKPISDDGTYNGNDIGMNSFLGSDSQQQYNLTGADLFLGEEILVRREITTNVVQTLNAPLPTSTTFSGSSLMSEFMGDINAPNDHYFYLRGTKSDGGAIKTQIQLTDSQTVDDLLSQIGIEFGNTPNLDLVNVSLNQNGQIVIEDRLKGSSKLDFHIVGATDFSGGGAAAAAINDIDLLDVGSTDYAVVTATPGLYVKEFVKSPYASAVSGGTTNDSILYDRTQFTQEGATLSSNVPQILKEDNAFATDSTKLHEVFSGITYNPDGTYLSGLDGKVLKLEGTTVSGAPYDISINLLDGGSTFTDNLSANTYDIFNVDNIRIATPASEVTYRQLMDVINMAATDSLPAANTDVEYDNAIIASNFIGGTNLTYDGKISFQDALNVTTGASMAVYDSNSDDFTLASSVATFNTNNALTVRDPKTDFFTTVDEMITAVENYKNYPDSASGEMRNVGMQNAIAMMDDLQNHVFRAHSTVGAQSNTLTNSLERTELLEVSTMTLRSSVIDTDLAEASLELTQLTINYEAMLSTVGRVSQLSLVNYL
ncbi:MAG: flagellar biosynthesis protein FlgL [Campylobacterota bacterium]